MKNIGDVVDSWVGKEREIILEELNLRMAKNVLAKRDFKSFVETAIKNMAENGKTFPLSRFHYEIIQNLQDLYDGKNPKIRLHMPPRHGKTFLTSVLFPMFVIGNRPWFKIMLGGATTAIPKQCISAIRINIRARWYIDIFGKLDIKKDNEDTVQLKYGNRIGFIDTIGIGGHLDGVGVNILILDDPYSGRKDAESQTVRDTVENWYKSTWTRRKETTNLDTEGNIFNPAEIFLMTRWQVDDLASYIEEKEEQGADKFKTLIFEAINEDTNEPLWPEVYDIEHYEKDRIDLGPYDFEAMYQQNPIKATGQLFKKENFQYFLGSDLEMTPELNYNNFTWGMFIDPATSTNKKSDDTVGMLVGKHKFTKDFYVLDIVGGKIAPSEAFNAIFNVLDYWKSRGLSVSFISIEQVAINKKQTQFKVDFLDYMRKHDKFYSVYDFCPRENKQDRIKYTLEPRFNNKKIFMLSTKDTGWNNNFKTLETELLKFPGMRHDDFPDALTQGVLMLDSKSGIMTAKEENDDNESDQGYFDPIIREWVGKRP